MPYAGSVLPPAGVVDRGAILGSRSCGRSLRAPPWQIAGGKLQANNFRFFKMLWRLPAHFFSPIAHLWKRQIMSHWSAFVIYQALQMRHNAGVLLSTKRYRWDIMLEFVIYQALQMGHNSGFLLFTKRYRWDIILDFCYLPSVTDGT